MINAGRLTEKLIFYRQIESTSDTGYKSVVEERICEVRAERFKNKENYVVNADSLFHITTLNFKIRWRGDVSEHDIVEYGGERYRIISFLPYREEGQISIILDKVND